jgi:Xaa-Pro aminopeptidase
MDGGEAVVIDAGAECRAYAADITRTIPVNGKFTGRQRELYELVLGAQRAAISALKPGMTLVGEGPGSLTKIAHDYIDARGKDRQGNPLGRYFLHGIGHHLGLDVHDPGDPHAPLEAGMVVTIEPGIYIADESIGVRIEDVVLVTENGGKVLSAALPSDIAAIEKATSR